MSTSGPSHQHLNRGAGGRSAGGDHVILLPHVMPDVFTVVDSNFHHDGCDAIDVGDVRV
jgi:hypothetical protein